MMKRIGAFFLLLSVSLAWADGRRDEMLGILNDEIVEVVRLNRQIGARNPKLILRLAELYLEKARIIREVENEKFLRIPLKQRYKVKKKNYFKNSRRYYSKAQKACYFILKKFKRFRGKAKVYYVLAFNAKEFQFHDKSRRLFEKSLAHVKRGSKLEVKVKLALGDIYFGEKKYDRAKRLYSTSIKKIRSKWRSRLHFNYAWTCFKTGSKSQAISVMKKAYSLSKDSRYVDVSQEALRDLALFFVSSNRLDDAISYFRQIGVNLSKNLIRVSKYLVEQGKFVQAQRPLNLAAKLAPPNEKTSVYMMLLDLYDRFGKVRKHLKISQKLKGFLGDANADSWKEGYLYQLKKMSSLLQKQVVSKTYRGLPKIRKAKALMAVSYFGILAQITGRPDHYTFFAGETLYTIGRYRSAMKKYEKSYEMAKLKGNRDLMVKSVEGQMACISKVSVNNATLLAIYDRFLQMNLNKRKTRKIYQRIYNIHFKTKNIDSAIATLKTYSSKFPGDRTKIDTMAAKIIDYLIARKMYAKLNQLKASLESGEISTGSKLRKKLGSKMLAMQFNEVESKMDKGNKRAALVGFQKIYNSSNSKVAKANAAYNITLLLYQAKQLTRSYKWARISLKHLTKARSRKFQSTFGSLADALFGVMSFNLAYKINMAFGNKVCSHRVSRLNNMIGNAFSIALAQSDMNKAVTAYQLFNKCVRDRQKSINMLTSIIRKYVELGDLNQAHQWVQRNPGRSQKLMDAQAYVYASLYEKEKEDRDRKNLVRLYHHLKRKRVNINSKAKDVMAGIMLKRLDRLKSQYESIEVVFPRSKFDRALKLKIGALDGLTAFAIKIVDTGSTKGVLTSYKTLVNAYRDFANYLRNYVPKGQDENFVKSFRRTMLYISGKLKAKSNDFIVEMRKTLNDKEILHKSNYLFTSENTQINLNIAPLVQSEFVVMERYGRF